MASLRLVVEFGGGYGDMAAMVREMGFRGTHVVYDLLPALLLQQYFLRTSNWPSYLLMPSDTGQEQGLMQDGQEPSQDVDDSVGDLAEALAGKTVLVPASTPQAMIAGVRRTTRASSTPGSRNNADTPTRTP